MNHLLPFAQSVTMRKEERYVYGAQHPILISANQREPRLERAISRLFPSQEPERKPLNSGWAYTLYWGPLEQLDEYTFRPVDQPIPAQGYALTMHGESAVIVASDPEGLYYGLHTLKQQLDAGRQEAVEIVDYPDTGLRVMNYDLRQTFSRPERLISYLGTLASLKTNALLIEYEDKFPFSHEGNREFTHLEHALSEAEFEMLKSTAHEHFIELIPLQQSFGHLEYILGRAAYRELRETSSSTGELCPLKPESFRLVSGLLCEIANRHPGSRYLHLGCDEVYSLCECPECRKRFGSSRHEAFVYFVNRLIDYACNLDKIPIIWQDMLSDCPNEVLEKLDRRVTVMIWHYNGRNIQGLVSPLMERLRGYGIQVWGAPAVRCFDRKDDQNYPLVEQRLSNIEQWTAVAQRSDLSGLVGTNWTAVFSHGVPYGVFETTWYTMAYFADRSWNRCERPEGDRFIDRFLSFFHGIEPARAFAAVGPYEDEDYYALAPQLLPLAQANRDVLELIAAMLDFETASDRSRTIHKYAYRWKLHPDNEADWRSLKNNYRITRCGLERALGRMRNALQPYQPEDMVDHYVLSRYYLHDHLEESLYRGMGLRLEGPCTS